MAIGNILWPFGIFCGNLVYFPHFGILDQEKSGNPEPNLLDAADLFGQQMLVVQLAVERNRLLAGTPGPEMPLGDGDQFSGRGHQAGINRTAKRIPSNLRKDGELVSSITFESDVKLFQVRWLKII
jgi:hypothetical protein